MFPCSLFGRRQPSKPHSEARLHWSERRCSFTIRFPMEDYGHDCPMWIGEASDTFHLFLIAAYSQWFGNVVTSGDLNRTYYVSDPELYDLEARVSWLNGLTPPPPGWEDWTPLPRQAREWALTAFHQQYDGIPYWSVYNPECHKVREAIRVEDLPPVRHPWEEMTGSHDDGTPAQAMK